MAWNRRIPWFSLILKLLILWNFDFESEFVIMNCFIELYMCRGIFRSLSHLWWSFIAKIVNGWKHSACASFIQITHRCSYRTLFRDSQNHFPYSFVCLKLTFWKCFCGFVFVFILEVTWKLACKKSSPNFPSNIKRI